MSGLTLRPAARYPGAAVSLYEHVHHPHASARKEQGPVLREQEHVGFNGRLAAAMTRGVGTMWVVYFTSAFVLIWMLLAQLGPLGFDRYPFPFLLLMGNVVQLLLVFVILVGQQVLGAAADKRAAQTFKDAEAILHEVRQLHEHLIAQDQMLTRGLTLFDAQGAPLAATEPMVEPPDLIHKNPGINGRIAAWLTEKVGTMWAFYIATVFQLAWMVLALAGILSFDPYPFAFLLFLSSLAQLILMFVIMVGQEVLGESGDERAIQTYQDAEAVLKECERLETHLGQQDEAIVKLVTYLESKAPAGG